MEKLTLEDKIMGRTEPLPKTDLQLKAFTAETKYIVHAEGRENAKTVDGVFVARILSKESKEEITNGTIEIKANGLVIKRIEEVEPTIRENRIVEEEQPPKPKRKRVK